MYNVEEKVQPFWASFASAASGRDPLAIQNSSVVIYSSMMVGITNVTIRIRYMGFFCWIFETILQRVEKKNSFTEQVLYLRRAELLLAYIMVHNYPDITGISGTYFASKNLSSRIDLGLGADWIHKQANKKVYWQDKNGIFGQYYSAVMRTLGLINHPSKAQGLNIYSLTDEGNKLARYYSDQILNEEQELFWSYVKKGSVSKSNLTSLQSFALHLIQSGSKEHQYYENRLLSEDSLLSDPTFHRRDTLQLILKYLNHQQQAVKEPVALFLKDNYHSCHALPEIQHEASTAWYLYELNELVHVAYEHFHGCFLYFIEPHPMPLVDVVQTLTTETLNTSQSILKVLPSQTISEWRQSLFESSDDVYEYYGHMKSAFKDRSYGECLMYSIMVLLKAYNDSEHQHSQLQEYAMQNSTAYNRQGYALELFEQLITQMEHLPLESYLPGVLMKAINVHTFSSYTKTKIGQNLVHNYMIEEEQVWRLRETLPSRTTPRLQNALQYMVDLNWVKSLDNKYQITKSGKTYIS